MRFVAHKEGLRQQSLKEIKGVQADPDRQGAYERLPPTVLTAPTSATRGVPMRRCSHKETQELLPIERTLAAMQRGAAKRAEVDGIRAWWIRPERDPREDAAQQ